MGGVYKRVEGKGGPQKNRVEMQTRLSNPDVNSRGSTFHEISSSQAGLSRGRNKGREGESDDREEEWHVNGHCKQANKGLGGRGRWVDGDMR